MSRTLSVAVAQMACKTGDVAFNVQKAEKMIQKAAGRGAQILCLPELFATGYNLSMLKGDMVRLGHEKYQYVFDAMSNSAKNNKMHIIAPFAYSAGGQKLYNSALLFDDKGNNTGIFSKTHYFGQEGKYFELGESYPVFNTPYCSLGIMICYDAGFPEVARALMHKGAEVIFVPSAWRIQDLHTWFLNIPSRALENQLFTVGVNRSGIEGDLHLCGSSMVCDPSGRIVAQMTMEQDEAAVCEIDLDEISIERAKGGYLSDLTPEKYLNN